MSSTSSEVDALTKQNLRRPCTNQGSDSMSSLECALGILYIIYLYSSKLELIFKILKQNYTWVSYMIVQDIFDFLMTRC